MSPTKPSNLALASIVGHISINEQRKMLAQIKEVVRQSPLVQPIAINKLPMKVMVTNAGQYGWVADGSYRYSPTDSNGRPWPEMPAMWREMADRFAGPHAWDSAVINWFARGASLGQHRDVTERNRAKPIVTFMVGDPACWMMRHDDESPIHRTQLESGAVTLLEGTTRNCIHAIEHLDPSPLFAFKDEFGETVDGRWSVSVRETGGTRR